MKILLNSIESFTDIINKYEGDYIIVSGIYSINAKSILGIFSLDITKPLELREVKQNNIINQDINIELKDALKDYVYYSYNK